MTMMTNSLPNRFVQVLLAFLGGSTCTVHTFNIGFTPVKPTASFGIANHPTFASSTALSATWSNGQAIQEYQDFLASGISASSEEYKNDVASVILCDEPMVTIAQALAKLGMGKDVVLQYANDLEYPDLPPTMDANYEVSRYPIYLSIAPSKLAAFLQNLPQAYKERYDDFVFLSGGPMCGCIEPILKHAGFCRDSTTQLLITGMSLPRDAYDERPLQDLSIKQGVDASGTEKKSGECAVCGSWQGAVAARLDNSNIACKTGFYREWRRLMWEQAAYDAVFNLVGAVREEPTTLADVSMYYGQEVSDMLWSIATMLRGYLAVTLSYGFEDRMFDLAEQRGQDTPCVVNDEIYPHVYGPFEAATMVAEYLAYAAREKKLLDEGRLPESVLNAKVDENPIMRQGNMRADGVV